MCTAVGQARGAASSIEVQGVESSYVPILFTQCPGTLNPRMSFISAVPLHVGCTSPSSVISHGVSGCREISVACNRVCLSLGNILLPVDCQEGDSSLSCTV